MSEATLKKIVQGNKNLPFQISDIIRSQILSGSLQAGNRLPTVRKIADDFHVSPVTVIKALDILEKESLIDRIPVSGIFVSDRIEREKKQLRACFAFPGKKFDFSRTQNENWYLNSEFFRGLLVSSQQLEINLQFTYFEENADRRLLQYQLNILRGFDFVIFIGSQLSELQQLSQAEKLTYCRGCNIVSPGLVRIDYDREDAIAQVLSYLQTTGCQTAGVLSWNPNNYKKGENFLRGVKSLGIQTPETGAWNFAEKDDSWKNTVRRLLKENSVEFLFCDGADNIAELYKIAAECNLIIGKDLIVTSIASGITLRELHPMPTFFRIPNYKLGIMIMEHANSLLRQTGDTPDLTFPKVEKVCPK